jgi:hypothetical protein
MVNKPKENEKRGLTVTLEGEEEKLAKYQNIIMTWTADIRT